MERKLNYTTAAIQYIDLKKLKYFLLWEYG